MRSMVDIIIPTFNTPECLVQAVSSLCVTSAAVPIRILVINNGNPESVECVRGIKRSLASFEIIQADRNLGWEGGLKLGLAHSTSPYVVFSNDDVFAPPCAYDWLVKMLRFFEKNPRIGAIGPSSNYVMGQQSIFVPSPAVVVNVPFLIGFFIMLRRRALDEAGGVDDSMPYHGDDIDLSIRLRKAGWDLVMDKSIFMWHYGSKTGEREFGKEWNSGSMYEKTLHGLIRKHGLKMTDHVFIRPKPAGEPLCV